MRCTVTEEAADVIIHRCAIAEVIKETVTPYVDQH